MLKIVRINSGYGDVQVLRDVSLEVLRGEIVSVIGPNAAGKTTLMRSIVGLVPPRAAEGGGIFFESQNLDGLAPEQIVRLGLTIAPEGARIFPDMSVLENLYLGAHVLKDQSKIKQLLDRVFGLHPWLADRGDQPAGTLSGGERQMLSIGRALMSDPKLLLLDEPSLGLHPVVAEHVFAAIQAINKDGLTVLMVEQKVAFSLEISNRAYVLENGSVAMSGPAAQLLNDPHVKKAYLAL
ncbi:MAG: ABC transporter ATP-binding protein [Thermodesulfobacteriota bacterium]